MPRKPKLQTKPSQNTFFNVAESLQAIDKWRDDMDDDDKLVSVGSYQQECFSPRTPASSSVSPVSANTTVASIPKQPSRSSSRSAQPSESNQNSADHNATTQEQKSSQLHLGPANYESDETIIQYMKEKHKSVAETKTRDGFRRYFRGIETNRLERILQNVFADPEKVRRRLQLMSGFYRHELQS